MLLQKQQNHRNPEGRVVIRCGGDFGFIGTNELEGGSAGGTVLTKKFLSCRGHILRVFLAHLEVEVFFQGKRQACRRVWECLRLGACEEGVDKRV